MRDSDFSDVSDSDTPSELADAILAAFFPAPAPVAAVDAVRLDYLQERGSTIDLLPGSGDCYPMRFRVGGIDSAVSADLRTAIDAAIAAPTTKGDKQ